MKNKLYKQIASTVLAYNNCVKSGNTEWMEKHLERLEDYNDNLPSGSGFDSGSKIDFDSTNESKITINTSYHFMDQNGFYDGWEDYTIVVKASLFNDFTLTIKGKNRDDIKDYMYEVFDFALREEVE